MSAEPILTHAPLHTQATPAYQRPPEILPEIYTALTSTGKTVILPDPELLDWHDEDPALAWTGFQCPCCGSEAEMTVVYHRHETVASVAVECCRHRSPDCKRAFYLNRDFARTAVLVTDGIGWEVSW